VSGKMRRKFALQYGFVVPEIQGEREPPGPGEELPRQGPWEPSSRRQDMRIGELLVVVARLQARRPRRGSARASLRHERPSGYRTSYASEVRREGFTPVDNLSVMDPFSEAIRNNPPSSSPYRTPARSSTGSTPNTSGLLEEICRAQSPIPASRPCSRPCLPSAYRSATSPDPRKPCRGRAHAGAPSRFRACRMRIASRSAATWRRRRPQRASPRQPLGLASTELKRDAKGDVN